MESAEATKKETITIQLKPFLFVIFSVCLLIMLFHTAPLDVAYATEETGSWSYRKKHTITGSVGAGTGYQVNFTMYYQAITYYELNQFSRYENNPLTTIPNYTANGAVHPDVIYFEEAKDNFQYYLVYTPYPPEIKERMSIVRSNNGIIFEDTDITNPVLYYHDKKDADPDMLYVAEYDKWFMVFAGCENDVTNATHGAVVLGVSDDGKTWSFYDGATVDGNTNPAIWSGIGTGGVAWERDGSGYSCLGCPTMFFEDGTFYLYAMNGNSTHEMEWGLVTFTWNDATGDVEDFARHEDNPLYSPPAESGYRMGCGHIDISKYENSYYMTMLRRPTGVSYADLTYATSPDKVTWTFRGTILQPQGTGWESTSIYRASILTNSSGYWVFLNGELQLYYSAFHGSACQIGLATGPLGDFVTEGTDEGNTVYLWEKCRTDFGDIRFTDLNGNFLDYWIQEKEDENYAVFWVEIQDDLDSDQSIYIYYGNSEEETTSNFADTFPQFTAGMETSDLSEWDWVSTANAEIQTDHVHTGAYGVKMWYEDAICGGVQHNFSESPTGYSYCVFYYDENITINGYMAIQRFFNGSLYVGQGVWNNENNTHYIYHAPPALTYGNSTVERSIGWHFFEARINTTHISLYIDYEEVFVASNDNISIAEIEYMVLGCYTQGTIYWDDSFARKWFFNEPVHGVWFAEENIVGSYTFNGLYDEATGLLCDDSERAVNVTIYYSDGTPSETIEDNGSTYIATTAMPLYFFYELGDADREYWLASDEDTGTFYIFNGSLTSYTIVFLDLAGLLDDSSVVTAQRYINGSLMTVERRMVDVENKVVMSLVNGVRYTITVEDGVSFTFGDLLMTSTTTIQLTLKAIAFPKETLMTSKYVRIYGLREFDTPNGTITITYQDLLNLTNSVTIEINYKNGTNVYTIVKYANSFNHEWSSASNDTDYAVVCTIDHERYGVYTWKNYYPQIGSSSMPWSLDWLGESLPFNTAYIIPALLVLFAGGCFSQINAEVGAFSMVIVAVLLAYMGWLPIGGATLMVAFAFVVLMGIIAAKRRVEM